MEIHPNRISENLIYSTYYAPRGRKRLWQLGSLLSQRYISPADKLIGVIGSEGAGKSTLIKALFPGLELTNDDDGVNLRPAPLYGFDSNDFFSGQTFHIDYRYESAFKQKFEILDAINRAIDDSRRVIIEHFDLIYEDLGYNANILFGIGEEVIVCRPTVFGPSPLAIKEVVSRTIKYRLMAHSAEDITSMILERDYGYKNPVLHSDVKHGFVISFPEKPDIPIGELESKVQNVIDKDVKIQTVKDKKLIRIGDYELYCTGPRTHVKTSGKIHNFKLRKEYTYDPINKVYYLIGRVGNKEIVGFEEILQEPEINS